MRPTINLVGGDWWYSQVDHLGQVRYRPQIPTEFAITYDKPNNNHITYFIKKGIPKVTEIESDIKVAMPTENRMFVPELYNYLAENYNSFDYIDTYDNWLIDRVPAHKILVTPYGNTFIYPDDLQRIYMKTKLCSYITSLKNETELQHYRVNLLQYLYQQKDKFSIDLFGRGHNPLPELEYRGKHLGLCDYAFSIAIENLQTDHYFSEKLIDCFLTGTIPIYRGCAKICDYFDRDGMILIEDYNHIDDILNSLSFEMYQSKKDAIQRNFELAQQYIDPLVYSVRQLQKI